MKLIIENMKNSMGDNVNLDLIYTIQNYLMYSIICMLEIQIWHDGRLGMGHWGEVILRDMADPIHRTIK